MGLLDSNYYDNLLKEEANKPASNPIPVPQPTQTPTPVQSNPVPITPAPKTDKFPDITVAEQTKRFGGSVGSDAYAKSKASKSVLSRLPGEIGSALGVELPPDEEWDKMSRSEQTATVASQSLQAVAKLIFGLPRTIASIPVGIYNTASQWVKHTNEGTPLVEQKPIETPFIGSVPSYFKTFDDAKKAGLGNSGASVMIAGRAGGDFLIGRSVAGALANSFAPRSIPLKEGEVLSDTTPIQSVLTKEQNKLSLKRGENSTSEYHPLTNTDAKKFGGAFANSGNTFFKFTPAVADGSQVELSIVKLNSGVKNTVDKLFGNKKATEGKFGKETKIYSQIIDTVDTIPKPPGTVEVKPTIPSAPLKGFADKPVTTEHIANLDAIGKANELDSGLQSGVVKALTGKDVVGDLTQSEYVNVAKTMANLSKAGQYAPEAIGLGNWMKNYFSPTRYWTRDVEQATGIPVHQAHVQLETGSRLAKVSEKQKLGTLYDDPIIDKYSGSKYTGERALVKEYMEGNTAAITENTSLSPAVKADLIVAAKTFDTYLKSVATDIGMDSKVFLDNYAPHVQERGGVFQLYKESVNIPGSSDAFFQQKRAGGLYTQINDPWALADIYTRSAYKAKYVGPALDKINEFKDRLSPEIKERFSSYVQEKLGYGGKLEKVMDTIAGTLNKKLGLNLPADTARVVTNQALNTMYSSAMSQPATWLRNSFQYPTMGFAYWGSKFMGESLKKAYSAEGMKEFINSGFSVDLGVPFGEELAQKTTMGKIGSTYKDVTQGILKPNSWVENRNRAPMYFQTKAIFDDTISKVNSGKLTWTQAEKALGLDTLNQIDSNLIRQDLVKGNIKGAFEKLAQNAIDDTQFPYRRGESWRLSYGMAGKLLTPFMQWPVEYLHTLGKWTTTGQWDKLARWYASSTLIARTFKDQYNTDFGKSLGVQPLQSVNLSPPPVTVITNGLGMIYNSLSDNEQAYEKNADTLFKTLRLAIPGGTEGANIVKFYDAYKKGPVGPDGTYVMKDSNGRPLNYSFKDLFWQALGMPVLSKVENQNLSKEMSKDKFDYSQAKKEVVNLYQDGMSSISAGKKNEGQKYLDRANELITEYGKDGFDISPSDTDFNKFYIPANEQTWNSLPDSLKAKYAPRVFKSSN